jgi:hypothetical protein
MRPIERRRIERFNLGIRQSISVLNSTGPEHILFDPALIQSYTSILHLSMMVFWPLSNSIPAGRKASTGPFSVPT